MEQTTNLAAALGRTVLHAAWDGHRGIVPVDSEFIAKVRDGAMVWYATDPAIESAYEFGQYKLVDGRPVWERKGVNGQVIGVQELADGELDAKVLRLVDPTILDAVLLDDAGLSPMERIKLTAKLSGMVQELVAIPAGSTGAAALKRAKLAQAINALSVALGGQAQAAEAPVDHRAMLEAAAALVRAEYPDHDVVLSDTPMPGTGRNLMTVTRRNLIQADGGLVFEVWVTPENMVGFQLREVRGAPAGSDPAVGVISGVEGDRLNEIFRGQIIRNQGGDVLTDFDIDKIEPKPTAAALGAGKKNDKWHAPVAMPDGRTLWTNGEVLLLGTEAPFPDMAVGSLIKSGAKRQATAEVSAKVFERAVKNATSVVQSMYGVDMEQALYNGAKNSTDVTSLPLVVMVSGSDVVTVKRAYLALAENWCGDGYRILMGDRNDVVYLKSKDGAREALIAPTKLDLTADELKAATARKDAKAGAPTGLATPVIAAMEVIATDKRPDGRTYPVVGDKVYSYARGMFGSKASMQGEVAKGSKGLFVRITGGGGLMGETVTTKSTPLTDDWTIQGEEHPADRMAREEAAALQKRGDDFKAELAASRADAIARNGTLDHDTVKLGDVIETGDGRLLVAAERGKDGGLYAYPLDEPNEAPRSFGDGAGDKLRPDVVVPANGEHQIREGDVVKAKFSDGYQPVEWNQEAEQYERIGGAPVAASVAPPPTETPSGDPFVSTAKELLRKFYADRGLTALAGRNVLSGAVYLLTDFVEDFIKAAPEMMPVARPARGTFSMSGPMLKAPYELASVELEAAPRGEWIIGYREWAENYTGLMSTGGSGKGTSGSSVSYDKPPSFAEVAKNMIGQEVYEARRKAQNELEAEVDTETAAKLKVGQVLKDVRIAGVNYSTAQITGVNPVTGFVEVSLSKRGSRKRWTGSVPASTLAGSVLDGVEVPCVVLHEGAEEDESQSDLQLA